MDPDDALLHSKKFHERVNHIVGENDFLREFIKNLQIDAKIKQQIGYEVGRLKENVSTIKNDATNSILQIIPSQVAHQITLQMPTYLSHNVEMQRILETHINDLKGAIENKARDVLKDVVEDPQYHAINKMYFESIDKKAERQLNEFKTNQNDLEKLLQEKVDAKLECIYKLQTQTRELESRYNSLFYYLIGSYASIGILGAYILLNK